MTQVQGRGRATALPLEERRSAIIAATLPLFLERGSNVTTREIAQAAGIAEGTIFRVFADKTALLDAVFDAALDTQSANEAIAAIDSRLPFERKLIAAVDIVRERVLFVFRVMSTMSDTKRAAVRTRVNDLPALTAILATERDHFERAPASLARVLRGLTFACVHPSFVGNEPLASKEIVATFLHGVRRTDDEASSC